MNYLTKSIQFNYFPNENIPEKNKTSSFVCPQICGLFVVLERCYLYCDVIMNEKRQWWQTVGGFARQTVTSHYSWMLICRTQLRHWSLLWVCGKISRIKINSYFDNYLVRLITLFTTKETFVSLYKISRIKKFLGRFFKKSCLVMYFLFYKLKQNFST